MSDEIVDNLKEPSQWLRIAFMICFAFALYVVSSILVVLTIAQALFCLITGKDNLNLRGLGKGLGSYVHQIVEFLTYNRQSKPFPFAPFPDTEIDGEDDFDIDIEDELDELEDEIEEEVQRAAKAEDESEKL